jgi:hemoglobin-like flavoprotein
MTPEQIKLARSSFARLEAQGDAVAALLYERLFVLDPSLEALFRDDPAARRAKLMAGLGAIVDALDRPQEVVAEVRELGRRHARYGVLPEHYATVGEALIRALAQALGPDFTVATGRAWRDAYNFLAWTMIAAAEAELRDRLAA